MNPPENVQLFEGEIAANIFTAMAMVSKPGLAQIIINMLFRFKPAPIV
jgi:hypothetical protein